MSCHELEFLKDAKHTQSSLCSAGVSHEQDRKSLPLDGQTKRHNHPRLHGGTHTASTHQHIPDRHQESKASLDIPQLHSSSSRERGLSDLSDRWRAIRLTAVLTLLRHRAAPGS